MMRLRGEARLAARARSRSSGPKRANGPVGGSRANRKLSISDPVGTRCGSVKAHSRFGRRLRPFCVRGGGSLHSNTPPPCARAMFPECSCRKAEGMLSFWERLPFLLKAASLRRRSSISPPRCSRPRLSLPGSL